MTPPPRSSSQVISDVPADSLFRTERPPTKEIVRYFIRHCALRLGMGESAPWVVEDELVKKFNLPSKFSDFLLDPHKVNTATVSRSCDLKRHNRRFPSTRWSLSDWCAFSYFFVCSYSF